jgi:hypothetical protein
MWGVRLDRAHGGRQQHSDAESAGVEEARRREFLVRRCLPRRPVVVVVARGDKSEDMERRTTVARLLGSAIQVVNTFDDLPGTSPRDRGSAASAIEPSQRSDWGRWVVFAATVASAAHRMSLDWQRLSMRRTFLLGLWMLAVA